MYKKKKNIWFRMEDSVREARPPHYDVKEVTSSDLPQAELQEGTEPPRYEEPISMENLKKPNTQPQPCFEYSSNDAVWGSCSDFVTLHFFFHHIWILWIFSPCLYHIMHNIMLTALTIGDFTKSTVHFCTPFLVHMYIWFLFSASQLI